STGGTGRGDRLGGGSARRRTDAGTAHRRAALMCRLFGISGGNHEVQSTFWLLDAPTSLLVQSETQPDGVGLGTFDRDGRPVVYRKPVALSRSQTFISEAHDVRSRTFLPHVRHATAGEPVRENTHPFEQHNRLSAHN